MNILHIEDDLVIQRAFCRMLRDHSVTSVESANDAIIAIALDGKYDVIISDYDLKNNSTGEEVLNFLKKNRPELVRTFIFCSGNTDTQALHNRVLMKPCRTHELLAIIDLVHQEISCSSTDSSSGRCSII